MATRRTLPQRMGRREVNNNAASSVCRQLGFADAENTISDDSLERYIQLFKHPLCREHVVALAALFGWEAPPESEVHLLESSVAE